MNNIKRMLPLIIVMFSFAMYRQRQLENKDYSPFY
jgi:preprotein translocase subunit YajC